MAYCERIGVASYRLLDPAEPGALTGYELDGAGAYREVGGAVLQVVQHLQRGAERVGGGVGRGRLAVQVEHVAADRHRGQAAVIVQLVPARAAVLRRVLPEGVEQVERVAGGDAGLGQAGAQAGGAGAAAARLASRLAAQHGAHAAEPGHLVGGRERGAVGDVVGVAGEGVVGVDVGAQAGADQRGADREVLVAAVLAGPGLDGVQGRAHAPAS